MSKVSIANRALAFLGENKITSLTDETQAARSINNMYQDSLKSILSECCWNFARKRAMLNMTTEKPAWGGGNYFQLPSDVIRIFQTTADFEIEGDKLLSNASSVGILYTYLNEDDSRYSPHFVDAFACRLAHDISFDLTNQSSKQENLLKLYYGHFLPIAKSANAKERTPPAIKDDQWVNAIYGGVNG